MLYKNDTKRLEVKNFSKYVKKIRFWLGSDENVESLIRRLHDSLQKGDLAEYFYIKGDLDFLLGILENDEI